MASGTKIRPLSRLLDACDTPLWAIDASGRLIYLSAGCASWLGVDIESLVDRRSIAGAPVSEDPLDQIAASLSPPPGLGRRGTASLRIQPPARADHRAVPLEVRFVRVGQGDAVLVLGVGGNFDDRDNDPELADAVAIRQRLDTWRKRHASLATIATAGVSSAARRMRRQLLVAASTRTDIGFFGPVGCGNESVAARIHQLSAPGESLVTVDGPLMDAELLDAVLMPLIDRLTESSEARGTALVRGLDEMPMEAQQRLSDRWNTFSGRLRLLALGGPPPIVLLEPFDEQEDPQDVGLDEPGARGMCAELIEILSAFTIVSQPLSSRVDDIPLLATAMLDARHAAGGGTAERLSRSALDALVIYPWPRDMQELTEAIAHAVRTATGPSIAAEHLPLAIRSYRPGEGLTGVKRAAISLDQAVQRYEARLINDAVEAASGNRAEAARRLGISRARLLRKLDEGSKSDSQRDGP